MSSRISANSFKAHDHPVDIHQKYLDFNSLRELPESYAWTPCDKYQGAAAHDLEDSVPVIDLSDPNASNLMGHACKSWGAFQVTNHGISAELLENIESAGQSLFSLPVSQKLKAARSPDGISGYGVARISSFFPKLMWSEGFTIFGSPLDHARLLWPNDYNRFCDVIKTYEMEMKDLADRLMWLVLGSLGITMGDIKWSGAKGDFKGACAALQMNSYPACPDPDRAMGLAAHTDSSLLTILYQNKTTGLQVLHEGHAGQDSRWVTVPPIPNAFVVNVGDLLHILSNGRYLSVLHRAMVNRTQHRLSLAYLYGPPPNVKISPVCKLLSPTRPPLYRPITWSEYLGTKAKHFDKALSSIRVCAPANRSVQGCK
ncbi:unnamed protein product [Rhodiola kirilowii]